MKQQPGIPEPYRSYAGMLYSAKTQQTSTRVSIYEAVPAGLDVGARFAVVCEDHGAMVGVRQYRAALQSVPRPAEFCDRCRKLLQGARDK